MNFILALAVIGLTAVCAVPAPKCQVGDWGEWTGCKSPKGACIKRESHSYVRPEAERKLEKGRSRMEEMMEKKNEIREYRHKCLAENTCPELQVPPSKYEYTPCVDGFAGEYPCDNVNMFSFINFEDLGFPQSGVESNDIWVWHDTQEGEDYVIHGTTHGSSFVRITDPVNPEVLGVLNTHTSSSTWRDMKVVNDHAFIISEAGGHGMQVFDLTQLRGLEGVDAANMREFENTAHLDNFGQSHNIASNPDAERVYVIGSRSGSGDGVCAGGLHTIDVSDPANPVTLYCDATDGYVHDTECFFYNGTDSTYTGRDICFGYNEEDLTIYDADVENGNRIISVTGYTGAEYTHQGWATLSRNYLLLDDELDEVYGPETNTKTYIWNIEDLENPILVATHYSAETSIDHNQYIVGDYSYQSNYESGLRVMEIDESAPSIEQVAYFDVFPSRTTANFFGTWSNYPWLKNNAVAVTSIDYGLFMLEVDTSAIEAQKNSDVTLGEQHRFRPALAGSDITACPPLVERRVCVPEEC